MKITKEELLTQHDELKKEFESLQTQISKANDRLMEIRGSYQTVQTMLDKVQEEVKPKGNK